MRWALALAVASGLGVVENYADVADEREIRIVPVGSFREALAALKS